MKRLVAVGFAFSLLLAVALTACGGDEVDQGRLQEERLQQERLHEEQLEEAKEEAAREARLEERSRQQSVEQKRLRRELDRLKRQRSGSGSGGAAASPRYGGTSCGGGISVGPNTSCTFARNVEAAYNRSRGGAQVTEVYSPATGRTYTITCSGGSPHVCTGGNNASVYFP